MALKRKKAQPRAELPNQTAPITAPPAPEPEAQAEPEAPLMAPLMLVAKYHAWVEPSTHQRFEESVPTEPQPYTEWLQCQVAAGNLIEV